MLFDCQTVPPVENVYCFAETMIMCVTKCLWCDYVFILFFIVLFSALGQTHCVSHVLTFQVHARLLCVCVCVRACVRACVCACMCVYKNIQINFDVSITHQTVTWMTGSITCMYDLFLRALATLVCSLFQRCSYLTGHQCMKTPVA